MSGIKIRNPVKESLIASVVVSLFFLTMAYNAYAMPGEDVTEEISGIETVNANITGTSNVNISIYDDGYSPQVITIPVNTTVEWTNNDGIQVHTTTQRDGLWDSGILYPGESFNYTFDTVGVYSYFCNVHFWEIGTINVVNSLATIAVNTDKTYYAAGDMMNVTMNIANPGDAINVRIYIWIDLPDGSKHRVVKNRSITLPPGIYYGNPVWRTITLPPIPRGNYAWQAILIKNPGNEIISESKASWVSGRMLQTDWTGGKREPGPVTEWINQFDSSTGVAWRSIPGQLALSSVSRATPVQTIITEDAGRPNSVAAGDINGDGHTDVISTDPVYDVWKKLGAIYWWQLLENGTWVRHTVDNDFYGAYYVSTVDMDSDSDLDVISAAYYGDGPELGRNGRYAWFENLNGDGTAWTQHPVGNWFWGARYIDAGDLDNDGDLDLVGASELTDGVYEQDGDIVWFENLDGSGAAWGQHDLDKDFVNAAEAHAVDLDSDGDMDIVGSNSESFGSSEFAWWENIEGNGTAWTRRYIPGSFWGPGYLDIGDIDNDGDLDLIGSGYNSGEVGWWENINGDGTVWQSWYVTSLSKGRAIELRDLDGDGDLDGLICTDLGAWWIENIDGNGLSWLRRSIKNGLELPWITAGDVNSDGKLDVIVSNEDSYLPISEQIYWFDLTQFSESGGLTSSILDRGADPDWGIMTWDADVGAGALLLVQVRASDNVTDLGQFVTVPRSGDDLGSLIDPGAQFLQYRLILDSSDPGVSPVVRKINVDIGSALLSSSDAMISIMPGKTE